MPLEEDEAPDDSLARTPETGEPDAREEEDPKEPEPGLKEPGPGTEPGPKAEPDAKDAPDSREAEGPDPEEKPVSEVDPEAEDPPEPGLDGADPLEEGGLFRVEFDAVEFEEGDPVDDDPFAPKFEENRL